MLRYKPKFADPAPVNKVNPGIVNEFWPFASGQGEFEEPHTVKTGLALQKGEEQGPWMWTAVRADCKFVMVMLLNVMEFVLGARVTLNAALLFETTQDPVTSGVAINCHVNCAFSCPKFSSTVSDTTEVVIEVVGGAEGDRAGSAKFTF